MLLFIHIMTQLLWTDPTAMQQNSQNNTVHLVTAQDSQEPQEKSSHPKEKNEQTQPNETNSHPPTNEPALQSNSTEQQKPDQQPRPVSASHSDSYTDTTDAEQQALLEELNAAVETDKKNTQASSKAFDNSTVQTTQHPENPEEQTPSHAAGVLGNETNPALSIILDFAGAYFSNDKRHKLGGHAPSQNGPTIQGAELAASANIDPYFKVNMAFGLFHLHLEELFATTTALPWNLKIRAGQFKADIGKHNPTHLHTWHFATQPLANQFLFGAEGLGLPGLEVSFLFPFPWYMELVGALQMGEAGSFRTNFEGDPEFLDFIYPTRLVQFFDLHDDLGLQLGLNAVFGTSQSAPEKNNRTYAYGIDLKLKWRPIGQGHTGHRSITSVTEFWFRQMEVTEDVWEDIGGYTDLIFGISKRWQAALRGELWRRLSGAPTNLALDRDNYGLTALKANGAISFLPSHFSRLRLQYSLEKIETFTQNHMVLLQLEISAGAHGAHNY